MEIKQNLLPKSKYNLKCPYYLRPTSITIHNTANDAPARNEVNYMIHNNSSTSFHYAVDDKEIVQGIPDNRNAWHCGNAKGNRNSLSIEICYSKSGGERFDKAEIKAAEFAAYKLKQYGLGIDKLRTHQSWSGKYCPHRTLDRGWDRFVKMVQGFMNGSSVPTPQPVTRPARSKDLGHVYVYYRVKTAKHGWLSEICDMNNVNGGGFAGLENDPIVAVMVKTSKGSVKYRVHIKGKGWLPYVTGYNTSDFNNGYAGDGRTIDAVEVYFNTPDGYKYQQAHYRVSRVGSRNYYPYQTDNFTSNGMDGYAGEFGKAIDKLQIHIE